MLSIMILKYLNQYLTDAKICNGSINLLYQVSDSGSCELLVLFSKFLMKYHPSLFKQVLPSDTFAGQ